MASAISIEDIISSHPQIARHLSSPQDKNVESFDEHSKRVIFQPIEKYIVPSCAKPEEKKKYYYISESFKRIFTSTASLFGKLRRGGLSVRSIEPSNLVFCGDEVKFRGLQIVKLEDEKDSLKLLLNLMENMINNYKRSDYEIPYPIEELFTWMRQIIDGKLHFVEWDVLLRCHFAVASYDDSFSAIRNFHSLRDTLGPNTNYQKAINNMERRSEYEKDWRGDFTHSKPELGAVGDCFNYKNDGIQVEYKNTNLDILRFCRNNEAHVGQHMRKYKKNCTSKDKFLNIMAFFDKELLSFMKLTFQYGIAHHFFPGSKLHVSAEPVVPLVSAGTVKEAGSLGSDESEWQTVKPKHTKRFSKRLK